MFYRKEKPPIYFYHHLNDDVVHSARQDYRLADDYQILPASVKDKIWNKIVRTLAACFGWLYSRCFLRVKVLGKNKLKHVSGGYFVYANHTQPIGDVFTPLTIFSPYRFYAIAGQANWGIPWIGKHLLPYGGLPVGRNLKQTAKLLQAIRTVIQNKQGIVVIYPEAHVWPYYTKIRPFPATSMHFPVALNAASFTATSTYVKTRFRRRPRLIIYIDGPFYPDRALPKKDQQEKLRQEIFNQLSKRAKMSNYSYVKYQKIG